MGFSDWITQAFDDTVDWVKDKAFPTIKKGIQAAIEKGQQVAEKVADKVGDGINKAGDIIKAAMN